MEKSVIELEKSIVEKNDLPFTLEEYQNRLESVRAVMARESVDVLIVNDPVDLNYLLGYRSFGYAFLAWQCVIITHDSTPIVITRKLESISYKAQTCVEEMHFYTDHDDPMQFTTETLNKIIDTNQKKIAIPFKNKYINPYHMDELKKGLANADSIVDGSSFVAECRLIKSDQEIKYIEQAATITSKVMKEIPSKLNLFPTEKEIASKVLYELMQNGSEYTTAVPLLGIGSRSSYGHATWEDYQAKMHDVIFLEFSGSVHRYFAPMMRTLSVGEPSDRAKLFEEASSYAINQVIENTYPGMRIEEIEEISKSALRKYNVEQYSHARTGYSVGIGFDTWLDGVSVKKGEKQILQENMVFHILPHLTDFNIGIASTETILIESNGARKLTNVPQGILRID